jgi:uncharacterized membrane protein
VPSRRLLLWSGLAFLVLAVLAAVRTADWSYGADTGTFVQIVLDAFGGMNNGVERTTHFQFHWSPTLVLLWPFLAATHSLWVLQVVLGAATVACAPLLAAIARARGVDGGVADRIGAVALVYPPLVAVGFGEFRDLGLLPVLALGWWLALERRAWVWLAVCAVLLAGLREDVCIELAILSAAVGIAGIVRRDRAVMLAGFGSALLGVSSVAWYALAVLPNVGPWPPSHFYTYPFADGPAALLLAPLLHPLAFVAAIFTFGRLTYILEAMVPLAFVPLRSRLAWLSVPGFAIVLLANSGLVWRMGMHYAALWIPWLLIAFAAGIATLRLQRRWTTIAFALSAIVLVAFSPLHPQHYLKPSYHALGDVRAVLARVPPSAFAIMHDEWYTAEAANRPNAHVFGPNRITEEFIVFAEDFPNDDFRRDMLPRIHETLRGCSYQLVIRRGAVSAYQSHPCGVPSGATPGTLPGSNGTARH